MPTHYFVFLQLSLVQLSPTDTNGRGMRLELKKYCPSMQLEFWSCMNKTLEGKIFANIPAKVLRKNGACHIFSTVYVLKPKVSLIKRN